MLDQRKVLFINVDKFKFACEYTNIVRNKVQR